tara:strand:- start:347 stop:697 length:351 start_codon:yes stop_codon:yes gene_type:complete
MAIAVYHAENFVYESTDEDGNTVLTDRYDNPPVYHHVADVDLPDTAFAEVFRLTNSIDGPWWENEGVTANFDSPAFREIEGRKGTRSTSVGDMILLSDGSWKRCASFGWKDYTPAA